MINNSVIFGQSETGELLYDYSNDGILIVGPEGSGKTAGISIPSLFTWRESAIILDTHQEEHYKNTANYRKKFTKIEKVTAYNSDFEKDRFEYIYYAKQLVGEDFPTSLYIEIDLDNIIKQKKEVIRFIDNLLFIILANRNKNRNRHKVLFIANNGRLFDESNLFVYFCLDCYKYGIKILFFLHSLYDAPGSTSFYDNFNRYVIFPTQNEHAINRICYILKHKITKQELRQLWQTAPTELMIYEKSTDTLSMAGKVEWYKDERFKNFEIER